LRHVGKEFIEKSAVTTPCLARSFITYSDNQESFSIDSNSV
jgi:hypothetical protein